MEKKELQLMSGKNLTTTTATSLGDPSALLTLN